jgi:hypothetical protein
VTPGVQAESAVHESSCSLRYRVRQARGKIRRIRSLLKHPNTLRRRCRTREGRPHRREVNGCIGIQRMRVRSCRFTSFLESMPVGRSRPFMNCRVQTGPRAPQDSVTFSNQRDPLFPCDPRRISVWIRAIGPYGV